MTLSKKSCVPCRGGVPPLTAEQIEPLAREVPRWTVEGQSRIVREFAFRDFRSALAFTNAIGEIAEAEGHHPDIHLAWGHVGVEIWTHKVGGLTESDFILAAKIDERALGFPGAKGVPGMTP
ncbi:MAG: 4a-hydroxytetrahydrobiopterin dehydratase [Planctomycetota bacterium]